MTFNEAFDYAANEAKAVTVEGPVRTWSQRFMLARRDRWQPSADERVKAVEAVRTYAAGVWMADGKLCEPEPLVRIACRKVGVGPLTVLWVVVMVTQLLAALRKLLQEPKGQG